MPFDVRMFLVINTQKPLTYHPTYMMLSIREGMQDQKFSTQAGVDTMMVVMAIGTGYLMITFLEEMIFLLLFPQGTLVQAKNQPQYTLRQAQKM